MDEAWWLQVRLFWLEMVHYAVQWIPHDLPAARSALMWVASEATTRTVDIPAQTDCQSAPGTHIHNSEDHSFLANHEAQHYVPVFIYSLSRYEAGLPGL